MSTPATIAPPVENPWKKRRKGPQEFMPPSRALLAQNDGQKATATWCYFGNHWKCISASGFLRWARGWIINPKIDCRFKSRLADLGITWHWIEPNTVRVLKPPF